MYEINLKRNNETEPPSSNMTSTVVSYFSSLNCTAKTTHKVKAHKMEINLPLLQMLQISAACRGKKFLHRHSKFIFLQ
jgi:hypothetical protein